MAVAATPLRNRPPSPGLRPNTLIPLVVTGRPRNRPRPRPRHPSPATPDRGQVMPHPPRPRPPHLQPPTPAHPLRPLPDGDQIYGVIRCSRLNQDGTTQGITARGGLAPARLER